MIRIEGRETELAPVTEKLQEWHRDPITAETVAEMTAAFQEMRRSENQAPFTSEMGARWGRLLQREGFPDCVVREAIDRVYCGESGFCPAMGEMIAVCKAIQKEIIRAAELEWFWEKNADLRESLERSRSNERQHLSLDQQLAASQAQSVVMQKIRGFIGGHSLGTRTPLKALPPGDILCDDDQDDPRDDAWIDGEYEDVP